MVKPHESNLQTGGKEHQSQEKMSCNCSDDNHPINKMVMLIMPILKKRENKTKDFCVTWYVNCSYVNYETSPNYRNVLPPPEMTPWQLYEECGDKFDALKNNLDECQHALMSGEDRGMLILQVPKQYAHCEL